ncbi:MAG: hypothetical protein HQK82_13530, partial [Desulfovibrionaceae bacterium]|nr:hypothetical protein [Desulfovibrionaceae bacterium]
AMRELLASAGFPLASYETAARVEKPAADGRTRDFGVFLAVGVNAPR